MSARLKVKATCGRKRIPFVEFGGRGGRKLLDAALRVWETKPQNRTSDTSWYRRQGVRV